mgnify:CR=1 FL=1
MPNNPFQRYGDSYSPYVVDPESYSNYQPLGARNWDQIVEQGWVQPTGGLRAGSNRWHRGQLEVGSRDDLYNILMDEARAGNFAGYTQQDIYDYFIRPGEEQRMQQAEGRFRSLYGQTERSGRQREGQLGARLGFGGTGLGARMARAVRGSERGGMDASKKLAEVQATAARGIERPGRLSKITELTEAADTGARTRAATRKTGVQAGIGGGVGGTLGAIGAAMMAASAGTGPGAAVLAPLGGILMALGGATGAGAIVSGEAGHANQMENIDAQLRQLQGGALRKADFMPTAVPTAPTQPTVGSSGQALSSAYGGDEQDQSFFYDGTG